MELVDEVFSFVQERRLIRKGDRVLTALSGGVDSTVLFHVLKALSRRIGFTMGVAHVNHLLRGEESERDQRFVESLAEGEAVPCYVKRSDAASRARTSGLSLQHAAREARYDFFDEVALSRGYDRIAVAHTIDDRVETALLRLIKGTGLKGFMSIPVQRERIVRPFLATERAKIVDYQKSRGIHFVEDSSNRKLLYDRNFIRHEIVPRLEGLNPQFRQKLILLLTDLAVINDDIEARAERFIEAEVTEEEGEFKVAAGPLRAMDSETRFRVLTRLSAAKGRMFQPLRTHVRLLERVLFSDKPNLSVTLPGGLRMVKAYEVIIFTRRERVVPREEEFTLSDGENRIEAFGLLFRVKRFTERPEFARTIAGTAFFDGDRTGGLTVRKFREGDRFVPLGMDKAVKLKNFFISLKVPRERRKSLPLVLSDGEIMWLTGLRIDERFKVQDETRNFVSITVEPL
jgi:tRNA(Ile)-lysidine synthase